jgi:hypothetical protein
MNASILALPAAVNAVCDVWGNIRADPIKIIEETHDDNFVNLFIYEIDGAFFFGYQIKVGKTICQKAANIDDETFETQELARVFGCAEIQNACNSNKNTRKLFAGFKKIKDAQLELFPLEG